jgi:hypothetical protein
MDQPMRPVRLLLEQLYAILRSWLWRKDCLGWGQDGQTAVEIDEDSMVAEQTNGQSSRANGHAVDHIPVSQPRQTTNVEYTACSYDIGSEAPLAVHSVDASKPTKASRLSVIPRIKY